MKIAWFCIPAHGHTNPTLGVVKELTDAGHQVYYFSFEMFRERIEQSGAVFTGCDDYDFDMEDKGNADRVGKDKTFATELLVSSTLALDEMTTKKIEEIRPDIIVSDSVAFWGKLVAKYFQPCSETFSDRYHFIGPSIRSITKTYEKTAKRTVYISMGTVNQDREFYRNCIRELGQTDWQVIISMGTNTEHFWKDQRMKCVEGMLADNI